VNVAVATAIVTAVEWHLACGAAFATLFLWRWAGRLDPAAREGTLGFRALVFPGVTMLWPLFAVRLARHAAAPPDEWTAHRAAVRRAVSRDRKAARS